MEKVKVFCPNCKKVTEVMFVLIKGDEDPHCSECGRKLSLDELSAPQEEKKEPKEKGAFDRVIVGEDSELLREIINDALIESGKVKEVILCENGEEALYLFMKVKKENKKIDLVILDLKMPIMSGVNAAIAIRAIERAMGWKKVPFLFFTIAEKTEGLVEFFKYVKPAIYLKKGDAEDPLQLGERLLKALNRI